MSEGLHPFTGSRADRRETMGSHGWEQGLLLLVEVNCCLSAYHPTKLKPEVSKFEPLNPF